MKKPNRSMNAEKSTSASLETLRRLYKTYKVRTEKAPKSIHPNMNRFPSGTHKPPNAHMLKAFIEVYA